MAAAQVALKNADWKRKCHEKADQHLVLFRMEHWAKLSTQSIQVSSWKSVHLFIFMLMWLSLRYVSNAFDETIFTMRLISQSFLDHHLSRVVNNSSISWCPLHAMHQRQVLSKAENSSRGWLRTNRSLTTERFCLFPLDLTCRVIPTRMNWHPKTVRVAQLVTPSDIKQHSDNVQWTFLTHQDNS